MAKTSPGEFVRQVRAEVSKVFWPTRGEVVRTSILVILMSALLAFFFMGVDQIIGRLVRLFLEVGV